jgi:hypothetical protein
MLRAATLFIDGKQMSNSGMLRRGNATSPAASVLGDVAGMPRPLPGPRSPPGVAAKQTVCRKIVHYEMLTG